MPRSLSRILPALLCLCLAGACLLPLRASAQDFRPLLADAVNRKLDRVVIPPGTYRLKPAPGTNSHVIITGAKNLTIDATGVVLICEELTRAVSFSDCKNTTLRGLTVDYDPLPFTQGTVIRIADDFSSIDIALHDGYPRAAYSRIDLCDPKTRTRKRGMPFLWGTKAELVGPSTVRVTLKGIGKAAAVGDLASLSTGPKNGGSPHAVSITSCEGMVFENVTVFSAPGFGIVENDGEGGMRYTGCRVVPGPKPAGATEERLLSSSWDAMQSKTMKKGPLVENCEIRDAGDDSWSVQSSDFLVLAVDGSKAVLAFRDEYCGGPLKGDRLTQSLASAPIVVTGRQPSSLDKLPPDIQDKVRKASPWSQWSASPRKVIEITADGPVPFHVGDSVYCPDRQGNGFVFRNNRINSPGRILIKAGDGLIENNTVIDGHSGVTVCPEVPGTGAAGIRNLVIRGNRFIGTGYFCPAPWSAQAGSVSITGGDLGNKTVGPAIFQNIVVENNTFEDINGPSIVVASAQCVRISGNTFDRVMTVRPNGTGSSFGIAGDALVWIAKSNDITASKNHILAPGAFLKTTVAGKNLDPALLATLRQGFYTVLKAGSPATSATSFHPGELWPDENGFHLNVHGGGILLHDGVYYWFGEHKIPGEAGNNAEVGVRVYSSRDLYNWKNEGVALAVSDDPASDIARGCILERPKVVYNAKTKKFVMWFHLELKGRGYSTARTAVAVADRPAGPYTYIRSLRPNAGTWPLNATEKDKSAGNLARDFAGGQMARDMTLFVDDDGTAYHIHASEDNSTLHISELTADYQDFTGKWARVFPGDYNEAPALFKRNGRYYLISSGCSGWNPNAARSAVADSIWGPWKSLGNPCRGTPEEKATTFRSQSTYVLPVPGKPDAFIFMGDRWHAENAINGRYVWLPIQWDQDRPILKWQSEWALSLFAR